MSHCRECIVIFVKALLKHGEKSCRDTLAIVHDSYTTRGVQIRSDRIRSDFGTKIYISDRIDKVVS